jgi:hypothetical protein
VGVDENTGLFGYINYPAVIKNLAVTDASIRGDYLTGSIVGKNYYATVSGCFSSGLVSGRRVVGGLVGENNNVAKIEDSYSTSTVFASDTWAGGLCALNFNNSVINNSYSIGEVISSNDGAGGLLAWNSGSSVNNSFWDIETSGLAVSEGGEGKTTVEMTDSITFLNAGWDLKDGQDKDIWNLGNERNEGYPYLNWQFPNDKGMQFLTFEPLQAKSYGDDAFDLNATVSSRLEVIYESSNTNVVTISGNKVTVIGAGSAEITASQPGNDQYHPAVSITQLLSVDNAILQVIANNKSLTYGDDTPLLNYTIDGFVYDDDETIVTGEPILSTHYTAGKDVLESPVPITIAPNTLVADNYDFALIDGEITIAKAPMKISVNNETKAYESDDPLFSVSYDSFVLGDDETELAGTLVITRDLGEDVGIYNVVPSGLVSDNYNISFVNGTLEITPVNLVITGQEDEKVYGFESEFYGTEFSAVGLMQGDAITSVTMNSDGAPVNSPVGEYPIILSDAVGSGLTNYFIEYIDGKLNVIPRILTIGGSFTVEDKLADGSTVANIAENNLVLITPLEGDDITLINLIVEFENAGPGVEIQANIVAAELAGADKENYELSMIDAPVTIANIIDDTSVQDYLDNKINLYPNPAQTSITITSNDSFSEVTVMDLAGKTIKSVNGFSAHQITLNISDLNAGLYFVAITLGPGTEILKLQKTE